jgi:Flp pilus assembly protein TadD
VRAPFQTDTWLTHPRVAPAWIAAAVLLAFGNSFAGPFVFDDLLSIPGNPTIRSLADAWTTPRDAGITAAGRPLLNFTFAVNWAISGEAVWSYHAFNLALHLATACLLFGVVRRSLRGEATAAGVAFTSALLWAVHPLTTAAVTYVVQRAESLAACWIVASLYAFVRSTTARGAWREMAIGAAFAGVATKETAAVIPLLVLLYDRCFVSGSFLAALRARTGFYTALASSWLLLAALVATTGDRGGSAGFGTANTWDYALTQAGGIVRYLRLAVWPQGLVFDYGTALQRDGAAVATSVGIVVMLLVGTVHLLRRAPRLGFLCAAFFVLLAPSSSIVPIATQALAEHRMYLPLAAVVALFARAGGHWWPRATPLLAVAIAAALGVATHQRNALYRDEVALWTDTARKAPRNERAWANLGFALAQRGDFAAAIPHYRRALELKPAYPDAQNNLGNALVETGAIDAALAVFVPAVAAAPEDPELRNGLGRVRLMRGELAEAEQEFRAAIRLAPAYALPHSNLGQTLAARGDASGALAALEAAVRLAPNNATFRNNLGNLLAALGRPADAAAQFEAALAHAPADPLTHFNFANLLRDTGRTEDAVRHFEAALAARADYVEARVNLAAILQQTGRVREAVSHYEAALRTRPGDPIATENLRRLRAAGTSP